MANAGATVVVDALVQVRSVCQQVQWRVGGQTGELGGSPHSPQVVRQLQCGSAFTRHPRRPAGETTDGRALRSDTVSHVGQIEMDV